VCWIVDKPADYVKGAARFLAQGESTGQKTVLFGPELSADLDKLRSAAAAVADPYVDFLNKGALDPEAMFAAFREQTAAAQAQGYGSLRVVADMDWLLPTHPDIDAVVGFELLLDRLTGELPATVICAYRSSSFDTDALLAQLAVHPLAQGHEKAPQFRLIAGDSGSWRLHGEIDLSVLPAFSSALKAIADGACVIDVAGLQFIDASGLRTIVQAALSTGVSMQLRGAQPHLQRIWNLVGFQHSAPTVQLIPQ
jgi:anti-anti-sigma factor